MRAVSARATRSSGGRSPRRSCSWSCWCSRPTCSPTPCATRSTRAGSRRSSAGCAWERRNERGKGDRAMNALGGGTLLEVENLSTHIDSEQGLVRALDGVSFDIAAGETFALLGESGCGKSMTALSLMRLLPDGVVHAGGDAQMDGVALFGLPEPAMREARGGTMAMLFQEPGLSRNPVMTVGQQVAEVLALHQGMRDAAANARSIELLDQVGIPD